jgi:prephenate dehydrogenase
VRISLLGLGLIGGSLARALHERDPGRWTVTAWSPTGRGPLRALSDGVIDWASSSVEAAVADAELVVLAAPPLAYLDLLDLLAAADLPADAVVTDVASTKRAIAGRAAALGLPYVGGHPMAGRDTVAYAAADPELFVDRPWVVCGSGPRAERVEAMALAAGARPTTMTPEAHDAAVAAISHLPLVVSAALVESIARPADPDWPQARALAAGGWRDMTRLARGDVAMGVGIVATNGDLLAARLRELRATLDGWLADLEGEQPDVERVRERLNEARRRLEEAG